MITNALLTLLKTLIDAAIAAEAAIRLSPHLPVRDLDTVIVQALSTGIRSRRCVSVACLSLLLAGFQLSTGWKITVKLLDWIADVIP